jgi:hypothetical protein
MDTDQLGAAVAEAAECGADAGKDVLQGDKLGGSEARELHTSLVRARLLAATRMQARARGRVKQAWFRDWFAGPRETLITFTSRWKGQRQRKSFSMQRAAAQLIQNHARRERVQSLLSEMLSAARMMKSGNVFIKFSDKGPPHDRWVWIDPEVTKIMWADPDRKKKGNLKEEAVIEFRDVLGVVEGCTATLATQRKKAMGKSFKPKVSGIRAFDEHACVSVRGKERSLEMQGNNKYVSNAWAMGFNLVLTHYKLTTLSDVANRKRLRAFIPPKERPKKATVMNKVTKLFSGAKSIDDEPVSTHPSNLRPATPPPSCGATSPPTRRASLSAFPIPLGDL